MTSGSEVPLILPVFWQTNPNLDSSFVEGLKIFYSRVPFFEVGEQPFIYGDNIDDLLIKASEYAGISWVAVFATGNIFGSQLQIVRQIENLITSLQEDVLVCGHLIDKKGFYCGLHEQCFIVNMEVYKRLGAPKFGDYEKSTRMLQEYEAGPSIHDDYTPEFIKPLSTQKEFQTKTCGWNFVDASLRAGLRVVNLPRALRRAKVFIYPDDETEKLNRNIRMLHKWEELENPAQRAALAHLLLKKMNLSPASGAAFDFSERSNCLFFFNTELLVPDNPMWRDRGKGPLDVYCGPCSGFQDVAFLRYYDFHENTRLVFYDINQQAIEMKNFIYDNFNGSLDEIPGLLTKIREMNFDEEVYSGFVDVKIAELLELFDGDADEFRKTWQRIRKLPREVMRLNLLGHGDKVFSKFHPNDTILLNVTDIFLGQNELIYGYEGMLKKFFTFQDQAARFKKLMLTGKSVNQVRFLDFAHKLNPLEI